MCVSVLWGTARVRVIVIWSRTAVEPTRAPFLLTWLNTLLSDTFFIHPMYSTEHINTSRFPFFSNRAFLHDDDNGYALYVIRWPAFNIGVQIYTVYYINISKKSIYRLIYIKSRCVGRGLHLRCALCQMGQKSTSRRSFINQTLIHSNSTSVD